MDEVTIDGVTYKISELTETARQELNMLQATDAEIQRLNIQLAIAQTARSAYGASLNAELAKGPSKELN